MADQWWGDDDQLLAELRDALNAAQAVPAEFRAAARSAYTWRTIDAELAELTYDSALDTPLGAGAVRADPAELRSLTFASKRLTIEVEITPDGLAGQITPARAGTVTVRTEAGDAPAAPIDDLGFFLIRPLPARPFRLLCDTASGESALTGWISP